MSATNNRTAKHEALYTFADDQWSSDLVPLSKLAAELESYIKDVVVSSGGFSQGQIDRSLEAIRGLGASPEPHAAYEVIERINELLDLGPGGLVLTFRVEVQLDSPVGTRVIYGDGVDVEDIDSVLPAGYEADYTSQVRTDDGRWSVGLVPSGKPEL